MKKLLFILNPCAGMRKANKILPEILSVFNQAGYEVVVHITQSPGDAQSIAARRGADMDLVVCCGGDGTFNETLSGLLDGGAHVPIGYIPAGSTNDFASGVKLSPYPIRAAKDIVEGAPQQFDLGRFGDRYFSYVASFGAFTRVSYSTPQSVKNALGHTAYVLGGIQELSQIRSIPVRLTIDDQVIEDEFIFGAICNCTSVGGILTINPALVDLRDGKFEILLVRAPKDLAEIGECILAVQRQQYNCKMMRFVSGSKIRIETEQPFLWTLDGERAEGDTVIEIENLHNAYQLMIGPQTT